MVLNHTITYFFSKGFPALLNLITLMILVRFFTFEEYGIYATVLAASSLIAAFAFQWLAKGMIRFREDYSNQGKETIILTNIVILYIIMTIFVLSMMCVGIFFVEKKLVMLAVGFSIALGLKEIILEYIRSMYKPKNYGILLTLNALTVLGIVGIAILMKLTIYSLMFLMIFTILGIYSYQLFRIMKFVNIKYFQIDIVKELIIYAFPVTLSSVFGQVIFNGSRLIIASVLGMSFAGIYSALYDLIQRTVVIIMSIVNLAMYPLIQKEWNNSNPEKLLMMIRQNYSLLLLGILPIVWILIVNNQLFVNFFLGVDYEEYASSLLPWIAFGVYLNRFRTYHLDIPILLAKKTKFILLNTMLISIVGIFMIYIYAQNFGLESVAIITFIIYLIGSITSYLYSIRFYRNILLGKDIIHFCFIFIPLSILLYFVTSDSIIIASLLAITYFLMLIVLFDKTKYQPLVEILNLGKEK